MQVEWNDAMNKEKLRQCVNYRIRLRPLPRRIWKGQEQAPVDDVWHVEAVNKQGVVRLANVRTQHAAILGTDHIHHFDSDPASETDGYNHGFFELRVDLTFVDGQLYIEPASTTVQQPAVIEVINAMPKNKKIGSVND